MSSPALIVIKITTKTKINSRFYGLPRVHKPNIPFQLIVSACDSIPVNFQAATHFIKPFVESLPLYIQDIKHLLQPLESLSSLPENAIMVNTDGEILYINIPHKRSIESVVQYMKLLANTLPSPGTLHCHTIDILFEGILKNNNFSFMGRYFLQQVGTAMGTKSTHPYVNHFMRHHEKTIQECLI